MVRSPVPALIFVVVILAVGLGGRLFTKTYLPARARMKAGPTAEERGRAIYRGIPVVAPTAPATAAPTFGTPAEELDMSKPHVMVATRGGQRILKFAAEYCQQIHAIMFVIYVRPWNVQFATTNSAPKLEEDAQAQNVFRMAEAECKTKGADLRGEPGRGGFDIGFCGDVRRTGVAHGGEPAGDTAAGVAWGRAGGGGGPVAAGHTALDSCVKRGGRPRPGRRGQALGPPFVKIL